MRASQIQSYYLGIFAVCAAYLVFQLVCIPFIWLEVDELWFAHHIYQYTVQLPYLDFPPYKTVLGYYLLTLPLYFVHGVLTPLYFIKDEIALINTLAMVGVAWWTLRLFQPRAVFYTLVLLISNQFFLLFSTELRVDMLSSWLCLLSILLVVNARVAVAGVVIGLAFLTSQKAFWYIVGTNFALGVYWLAAKDSLKNFRVILRFNLAMLAVVAAYVGLWAYFSSFHEVWRSVFYEAYTQSKIDFYAYSSNIYWIYVLRHGPLLVMLLPLTLLTLFSEPFNKQRFLLVIYGLMSLFVIATYKQFFPYNGVFLLPAFFVLFAEFFSWLLTTGYQSLTLTRRGLAWFFSVYLILLIAFVVYLGLATPYFMVLLIPLLLWHTFNEKTPLRPASLWVLGLVMLFTGVFIPLADFGISLHIHEAKYQKATILLADELLKDQDYIAGTFIFHDRDLSVAGFENLIAPAQKYAQTGDVNLLPILISSLNITPKTAAQMLDDLKNSSIKLVVNNVRIAALPPAVLDYLREQYQHYWGGLYLYAPTVSSGEQQFLVKFSGKYMLVSKTSIMLDKQKLAPQTIIQLAVGMHASYSDNTYRLRLLPEKTPVTLNRSFQHDCPFCLFKEPSF